jgi:TfoX/Sxy family transcriptional regulator of competence genes
VHRACRYIRFVAYDEDLADRIRELVTHERGVTEKRMFGGLGFLVDGNLAVSASGRGGLLVRVEPGETAALLRRAHVHPFETRGRELDGWLRVDDAGVRTKRQLESWVRRGVAFARSVPPKR